MAAIWLFLWRPLVDRRRSQLRLRQALALEPSSFSKNCGMRERIVAILDGRLERRQVPREVFFRVIALDNQSLLLTLQYISLSLSQHKTKNSAPLFSAAPGRKVARARERETEAVSRGLSLSLFHTYSKHRMPPPDPAPDPSYSSREGGLAAGDLSAFNEVGDVFFFFFLWSFF